MSDVSQMNSTPSSADEAGDGGANIDQQPEADAQSLEDADVETSTSEEKQAEGDFPIMS